MLYSSLQEKLMNSDLRSTRFFFTHFNLDFDRIGMINFPLMANSGVYTQRMGEDYQKKYQTHSLMCLLRDDQSIPISTYDKETFYIQIFLDQYGYLGRPLPVFSQEVIDSNLSWPIYYKNYDEVHQAMQLMLKPLNTYDDFIERIREIEAFRQRTIIHPKMLPLGNINDWVWGDIYGDMGGYVIEQIGESEWRFVHWLRGYKQSQSSSITFFREQAIYEWLVNSYLSLL